MWTPAAPFFSRTFPPFRARAPVSGGAARHHMAVMTLFRHEAPATPAASPDTPDRPDTPYRTTRMTVTIERSEWLPALRPVGDSTAVAAIGDVHGQLDLAEALRDAVLATFDRSGAARRTLVWLGDLTDRGPAGIACIDLVRHGAPRCRTVALEGNHEAFLTDCVTGTGHYPQQIWLANGGDAVLREAGVEPGRAMPGELARALGPDRIAWLEARPRSWRCGDLFFVHAGIDPSRPLADQDPEDLIWIRERFLMEDGPYEEGIGILHGHTPVRHVETSHPHRIDLDTGAFYSGVLSALVLVGEHMQLVQAMRA